MLLMSNLNIYELTAQTQSHGNLISEKERGPGSLKAVLGDVMTKALRLDPVTAAFGSRRGATVVRDERQRERVMEFTAEEL